MENERDGPEKFRREGIEGRNDEKRQWESRNGSTKVR